MSGNKGNYIRIEDFWFPAHGRIRAYIHADAIEWDIELAGDDNRSINFTPFIFTRSFGSLQRAGFNLLNKEFRYNFIETPEFFISCDGDAIPVEKFDVEFYRDASMPFGEFMFLGSGIVDPLHTGFMYTKPCFVSVAIQFMDFYVLQTDGVDDDIDKIRRFTNLEHSIELKESGPYGGAIYAISPNAL